MSMDSMTGQTSQEGSENSSRSANPADAGGALDYSKVIEEMKGEHANLYKDLQDHRSQLSKIKKAFSPEETAPDPEDEDRAFLDHYLSAALESEKAGTGGLPLTTQLANTVVEMKKMLRAQSAEIASLKGKAAVNEDPVMMDERQTYRDLDKGIEKAVESIYGENRPEVFKAVTESIVTEIRRLKTSEPEKWNQIKKSERVQAAMINHFVSKVVPPKAREVMEDKRLRETEMPLSELHQAFKEADKIKNDGERRKIKEKIRQEILTKTMWTK